MNAWITPDAVPSGYVRRVLLVPDSWEWETIILGCLYALTEAENWESVSGVTAEQAAARADEMFTAFIEGEVCP